MAWNDYGGWKATWELQDQQYQHRKRWPTVTLALDGAGGAENALQMARNLQREYHELAIHEAVLVKIWNYRV